MASPLETVLNNARIEYHMWQPDAGTYEILLMSRSGKGIVDVKVSREKNKRWRVESEVAEWLVEQILESVAGPTDSDDDGEDKKPVKRAASKKSTPKKGTKKAATKKMNKKKAGKVAQKRQSE